MEIWAKSLKTFTKSWKSEQTPENMTKNGAQNNMELFFGGLSFMEFFSGKFWRIRPKILRTPKNLPAQEFLVLF